MGEDTAFLLSRFGAACVYAHDTLIVLGGIGYNGAISRDSDIVLFSTSDSKIQATKRLTLPISHSPRPLLVGSSVVLTKDKDITIIGGAATCFSMGTFCMSDPVSTPPRPQTLQMRIESDRIVVLKRNRCDSRSAIIERCLPHYFLQPTRQLFLLEKHRQPRQKHPGGLRRPGDWPSANSFLLIKTV